MIRKQAITLFLLLLPVLSFAQLETQFQFNGQHSETLKMDQVITVLRAVPKEVPSTCTRQVPEEVYRCQDVTKYREQCEWIPARQNCWTENESVCRPVTRYRQECTQGPSREVCTQQPTRQVCTPKPDRQVCTDRPSRQECSTGPSREVCTPRPSRQVCNERPTRQVCRTKPDGTQHCTTVGGGQHCREVSGSQDCRTVPGERQCRTVGGGQDCRTVPGGQSCTTVGGGVSCNTVPGQTTCREVSYQDQECHSVPRQRCETIPAHNDCRDIPYTEQVCGNVTEYRTESYACTKTEMVMEPVEKTLTADVQVEIETNGLIDEFPIAVSANALASDMKEFQMEVKVLKEPKYLLILKEKSIRVMGESEQEIRLEGLLKLELKEVPAQSTEFPARIWEAFTEKNNGLVTIMFKGKLPPAGVAELEIKRKNQVIATLKDKFPSESIVKGELERKDTLQFKLTDVEPRDLRRGRTIDLKLSVPLSMEGEILNAERPETEKVYQKVRFRIYR